MKRFFKMTYEITKDMISIVTYSIKCNMMNFATFLEFCLPYAMYFIGKGKEVFGFELLIPVVFMILIYYIKSAANKLGKGNTVPIPEKRFTEIDDEGEVSIAHDRLQELILYMADLEDWLDRKGLSK